MTSIASLSVTYQNASPFTIPSPITSAVEAAINSSYPLPTPAPNPNPNPMPTKVQIPAVPFTTVIHVGPTQVVKTIDQLKPLIKDNTAVFIASNTRYAYDNGIDLSKRINVAFYAEGTGTSPEMYFSSTNNPTGRYPTAINAAGTNIQINGLNFTAGNSPNTTGINITGTNILISNCFSAGGSINGKGFSILSTHDVTLQGCSGTGYYGVWLGKEDVPEMSAPLNTNIVIDAGSFAASIGGHGIRVQMSNGVLVNNCTIQGPSRDGITIHECNNIILLGNHLNQCNIGIGPLAEGVYLDFPLGANRDFCIALTVSNVLIENNTLNLLNDSAITCDIGCVNVQVINNTIITPVPYAVNVKGLDSRYPKRLMASGVVSGNTIHGPVGTIPLKAATGAPMTQSNNTVLLAA